MYIGVDTASVAGNKTIDWAAAKAAGLGYGIIRAAYGTWEDSTFDRDWPKMRAAGVVRGAYLFLRFPRTTKAKLSLPKPEMLPLLQRPPLRMAGKLTAGTVPTPTQQAEAFCKIVGKLEPNDFPPSLDVEFPGNGAVDTGMTSAQLLKGVIEAWTVLKNYYGAAPIIYTSARVWLDDLRNLPVPAPMLESLLWLARYAFSPGPAVLNASQVANPPVPVPWAGTDPKVVYYRQTPYTNDNWAIHQYQGDAVKAPGFATGNVDMNRMRPMQKEPSPPARERVKWAQRRLGFKGTDVDGKFGSMTDTAVRKVQNQHSDVVADGIINPRTLAYLSWMNP
jgi:GH25 family lysozyme M1 (1,4-beta-N-acetylmuramidase)